MELVALSKIENEFAGLGATQVAISPQSPEFNRSFRKEKTLAFDILSDPGNQIALSYGLRHRLPDDLAALYQKFGLNLPEFNGDDSWTLPMPARLVIDGAGIVRDARINADYTIRPEPEDTLAVLRALAG